MPAMSQPAILPFVHAQGSWGEIGHTVGSMFAPLIADHVEAWTRHVIAETGATRRAVLEAAAGFRAPIEAHAPFLWEEIEGMARGAGLRAQIAWSAVALASATGATAEDSYLSVLPLPLLLETICSIFIPAMLGAHVHFDTALAEQVGRGDAKGISRPFELRKPTTSVVVPQLLKQWVGELQAAGSRAPNSLRFVAVGGAPVPQQVADRAWTLGIPIHEGYGLSECCSVVAVNRPGERCSGTVGRPLDRLDVSRLDDEIHISAVARSFLHNQVRSMVGSLEVVGNGKWQAVSWQATAVPEKKEEPKPSPK